MPRREPTWPQVLILEEKHSTDYMLITSRADLEAAALAVLKRRASTGYWYPSATLTAARALHELESALSDYADGGKGPGFTVYDTLFVQLPYAKRAALEEREANQLANDIMLAIQNNDGALAVDVLDQRADYEYEGFRLESFLAIPTEETS